MSKARDRYRRAKRLAWALVEIAQVSQEVQAGSLSALLWAAYTRAQLVTRSSLLIGEAVQRKLFGHLKPAKLFPIKHPGKCFVCDGSDLKCPACKGSGTFEL